MPAVFISYRRSDSAGHVNTIFDKLQSVFGEHAIFLDRSGIELGENWRTVLDAQVKQCKVMIAVIGKNWDIERINKDDDVVRFEIAAALKRKMTVIPVIVDGADIPSQEQLPANIRPFTQHQALWLNHRSHAAYQNDIKILVDRLTPLIAGTIEIHHFFNFLTGKVLPISIKIDGKEVGNIAIDKRIRFLLLEGEHDITVQLFAFNYQPQIRFPIKAGEFKIIRTGCHMRYNTIWPTTELYVEEYTGN
jgi:hypothetical protein